VIKFGLLDRVNITDFIRRDFARKKSLGGNATKNLYLLRFLPLLVGDRVPHGDRVWECLMCLREIILYVYAEAISEHEIIILENLIREHRHIFHVAFPGKLTKPKHHYLEHYPQLIREFGPLVNYQTIRFEAKHAVLKRIVHQTMNFKNVCLTLAERHQLQMTYLLASGAYFKSDLETKSAHQKSIESMSTVQKHVISKEIPAAVEITVYKEVTILGQKYFTDTYLPHGFVLGHPEFCRIDTIFSYEETVYFLCTHFQSSFCLHNRAYEIFETAKCHLLKHRDLISYCPLYAYPNNGNWIYLKHGVFQ